MHLRPAAHPCLPATSAGAHLGALSTAPRPPLSGAKRLAALLSLVGLVACGSRSSAATDTQGDPLASSACSAYLETYRGCMATMATPDVVDKRVEAMRSTLARQAESRDATSVRQFCTDQQKTLLASCH